MKCIDLRNENIKILGIYFSYNQKIKNVCNIISNIQELLNLWRITNLTLEARIIPYQVVKELEQIQKSFLWKDSTLKIRHATIYKDYKDGGLKNVDISYKIVSLQCS